MTTPPFEPTPGPVPPRFGTGTPCTNDALRRATRQLGLLYDEAFAPTGLKATQMLMLWRIASLGGPDGPTLLALSEELAVGVSALTHALRPLMRDGLVDLRPDARDRRAKHAILTATGRSRLDAGVVAWSAATRRVEALLGPAQAQMLRSIADRVASDAFATAFRTGLDSEIDRALREAASGGGMQRP